MGVLDGKLALVTGASRGIGAATAEALATAGAHVILVARTSDGLEEVEARIHAAGGNATIAPLDLTDGESISKLALAISDPTNVVALDQIRALLRDQQAVHSDIAISSVVAQLWRARSDRYSELRSQNTEELLTPRKKIEMSYIGG